MWKVLIADDEPKILRGLSGMLKRMPLELEIVGLADNGLKALELAEQLQPDLMLVDINMPFLNGLELIDRLRGMRQEMKIIVITGYEEFEYARQALEMSVFAYLLKPVGEEELQGKLEAAIRELSLQRERRRHYAFAMEQIERRKDMLLENFLRDVVENEYEETEIAQRCLWFGLDPDGPFELLLIIPLISSAESRPEQDVTLRYEVEGAIRQAYPALGFRCLFSDARGNVLALYEPAPGRQLPSCEALSLAVSEDTGTQTRVLCGHLDGLRHLPAVYDSLTESGFEQRGASPIVTAAQRHIARNYMNPSLGLPDTAEVAGVTPTYLSRLMKQELGMSFSRYLNMTRVKQSVSLMEKGLMLKDIALRVGYSSPYYFSTAFKKVLSVPPNEYRSEVMKK